MVRRNPKRHVRHALESRLRDVCPPAEFAIEEENADKPNIDGLYCSVVYKWMENFSDAIKDCELFLWTSKNAK